MSEAERKAQRQAKRESLILDFIANCMVTTDVKKSHMFHFEILSCTKDRIIFQTNWRGGMYVSVLQEELEYCQYRTLTVKEIGKFMLDNGAKKIRVKRNPMLPYYD